MRHTLFKNSIVLAIIACVLWSTAFAGIKTGLMYTTPLRFASLRFMLSGILIFPFVKQKRVALNQVKSNIKSVLVLSFFQTFALYALFYLGMDLTPASAAAVIMGAGPLYIAAIAHFTTGKDQMTIRKAISLGFGILGIIFLTLGRKQLQFEGEHVLRGILILVTGSIAGSYGNVLISQNKSGVSPVPLNAVQIFLGGFGLFILSLFMEGFHFDIKPWPYYLSLLWLTGVSAGGFTIWFVVLTRKEVRVSEINIWKFIIPALGAVLSWIVIPNDKPTSAVIIGFAVISMALIVMYSGKNNKKAGN